MQQRKLHDQADQGIAERRDVRQRQDRQQDTERELQHAKREGIFGNALRVRR